MTPNGHGPEEPRCKPQVWCPKEARWVPQAWVAEHLDGVHGIPRRMVMQGYGGTSSRSR